ncbi:hypothetical protein [Sphingopyxis sp. MWB1]|uniref:hypothetical protein n=1 Tax=Sphingopyxis sp. MWB1 TaxID=1537715 RepID=UPI001185F8B5|nr:hypothetical protein [Sphingopyxis sp. MWB1]
MIFVYEKLTEILLTDFIDNKRRSVSTLPDVGQRFFLITLYGFNHISAARLSLRDGQRESFAIQPLELPREGEAKPERLMSGVLADKAPARGQRLPEFHGMANDSLRCAGLARLYGRALLRLEEPGTKASSRAEPIRARF